MTVHRTPHDPWQPEFNAAALAMRQNATDENFQTLCRVLYNAAAVMVEDAQATTDTRDTMRTLVTHILLNEWALICSDLSLEYVWEMILTDVCGTYASLATGNLDVVPAELAPTSLTSLRRLLSIRGLNVPKARLEREMVERERDMEMIRLAVKRSALRDKPRP